jgi:hypothetical protein
VAFGAGDATAVIRKPAPEGGSETLAACAMLEMLALDGVLVVVPAEQVRNEPAVIIHRRGGAYLVPVPANRPAMHRALSDLFAAPPKALRSLEAAVPLDGGVEIRRHRVARHVGCLLPSIDGTEETPPPGLVTVACVEVERAPGATTTSYYLASAPLDVRWFARAVAGRSIGTARHWVLDPTSGDNRARSRRDGAENLAILRRLGHHLLERARPGMSLARKRLRAGTSDAFARTIIGQMR